ncbi:hypothetical protein OXV40_34280, partial [Burkholderia contaminans]
MLISDSRARFHLAKPLHVACLRLACAIGAFVGIAIQVAVAQSGSMLPPATPNRTQTILAQAAQAVGIRRCLAAVEQVSERMFA